ncbi:MAG TPA: penicillin acylase family protein, partial [Candidatus Thermoplasmatota archaeon]|nr:penicillin acylase family protein [Candidatus Thermoplasmatota archaeon]
MRPWVTAAAGCLLLVAMVSGCFSKKGDGADDLLPTDLPPVLNTGTSAPPFGPAIPPCALTAQELAVLEAPGAPKPGAPVSATLQTDAFGVTHITADDPYALFYANGYVQARDRLFQMDVLRHVAYGDSAAFLGAGQLASDMSVARDLYTKAEMQVQLDSAPAALQEVLQAYSDGVNRFLTEAVLRNALPGEFAPVSHAPEPWAPLDSVAIIDFLIGRFGVAGGSEILNAARLGQLNATLGDGAWDAFADLGWLQA